MNSILAYYRDLGVDVPQKHARMGLLERWLGYLPLGTLGGYFLGTRILLLYALAFLPAAAAELFLMARGCRPWTFFRGKPLKTVVLVFLLEAYNVTLYFMVGVLLGILLSS